MVCLAVSTFGYFNSLCFSLLSITFGSIVVLTTSFEAGGLDFTIFARSDAACLAPGLAMTDDSEVLTFGYGLVSIGLTESFFYYSILSKFY